MKTITVTSKTSLSTAAVIFSFVSMLTLSTLAYSADNWKEPFDEVCGQVMGAESMNEKDLSAMIQKADKILPQIQASDDPGKKVYLNRLKKCRAVYEFILESKKSPGK